MEKSSTSVTVTGIRVREKQGLGKIKHEPISGTLGRNQRSSQVSEPAGDVSVLRWKQIHRF